MKLVTGGTGPTSSPSAAARSEADKKAAGLRAVGLADGKLDLLAQSKHLRSVSILAYYSETEKQVHIRGTEITINTQVTLVHELVHALQDQHYDLGKLGRLGNESKTDAVRSLIEGDAVWVEKQYLDGLSKQDRAAYFKANKDAGSKINQDTRDSVPDILVADQSAPYQFGPVLIEFLHHQGAAELDAAFQHPPLSDFLVFQPKRFLSGTVAQRGPKVQLPAGANKAQYEGEFGAIWWYSMLAERLDAHRVLDALDGWAGDELWTYEHNGKVCLALDWNAKNGATQTAMRTVLNAWRAKMPAASDITVTDRPSSTAIEVIACDPGIAVTTVTHQAKQQFSIPLVRAEVAQGLLHSAKDASTGAAWCVASKFVQRYTAAQLASDTAIPAREIRKVILELRRTCRSQPEFGA